MAKQVKRRSEQDVDYRQSHASRGYGAKYDRMYSSDYYAAQWREIEAPLLAAELERLRSMDKRTYLDFACGTGRVLGLAEKIFDAPVGVDISSAMAERAEQACQKSEVIYPRDIVAEPLGRRFEVITAFRFFLNAEKDLRLAVLNRFAEMQEPGDYLVANIHVNSSSMLGLAYRAANKVRKTKANVRSAAEAIQEVERAGYVVEKRINYSFWPRIGPWFGPLQGRMLTTVERIQRKLGLLPPTLAQSFMLICRRT